MIPATLPADVHAVSIQRTTEFGRPTVFYAVTLVHPLGSGGANWTSIGATFEAAYDAARNERARLDAVMHFRKAA